MAYIINHQEYGVFVGTGLGMAFWTALDCAGQERTCVFPSEEEAEDFCRTVLEMDNDQVSYIEIKTSRDYADAKDLMVAGLEDASHALMKERLSNMEVSGPMM